MDPSPSLSNTPDYAGTDSLAKDSDSEFVLGYPEMVPPGIDLGPVPSGVGAKPSARAQGVSPNQEHRSDTSAGATPAGPPLPKRPKGRLFIGTTFLLVLLGIGLTVFNTMLRYTAYGQVIGRRIELAVPWPGVVQSVHVREGDRVEADDVIARIDSLEMRQKIDEIDDSLRLERARLSSELAMLRWEAEKIRDTRKLSLSEFYDKWASLLWEQSRLTDLRMQVKRAVPMHREGAVSEQRIESLRFQLAGQEKRVEQLTEAVRALRHRGDESPVELALEDRVQPTLTRIENLQSELQRTRVLIQQGEIRAPAAGRIVRMHRFVGEYADQMTPVAELLVDGSTELVLYLPQTEAQNYPIGATVTLQVRPIKENVRCEVQRVAMETQTAPDALAYYYRSGQQLLPVYLRATDLDSMPTWLALGSEVRLPRCDPTTSLSEWRSWWYGIPVNKSPGLSDPERNTELNRPLRVTPDSEWTPQIAVSDGLETDGRPAGWIRRQGSMKH